VEAIRRILPLIAGPSTLSSCCCSARSELREIERLRLERDAREQAAREPGAESGV
jgi:hypothetical protein